MSEPIVGANKTSESASEAQLRNLALLVYVLQGLGFVTGGLAWLAALLVNYLKMSEVRGTWLESHFRWQLNTFWYGILWCVVAALFWLVLLGWLAGGIVTIWLLYRIIKGLLYLNDSKPIIF
jgi:uncharacterized membrane protein